MPVNLISKYLEYKKKRLTTYGLAIFSNIDYRPFITECFKKYFNNYVEVVYHHELETMDKVEKITKELIEIEQEGMRLELLDDLSVKEIVETNEGYIRKQRIINETKVVAASIIKLDQMTILEEELDQTITKELKLLSQTVEIRESAKNLLIKEWQETKKTITLLLEPNKSFSLEEKYYGKDLCEVELTEELKQLDIYKRNLVERVNQEEKINFEKKKLLLMILNQVILEKIITKKSIGTYIVNIEENIWKEPKEIESLYELLNDKILKETVMLGITHNELISSKKNQAKKKEGYHFVCYQDFTYINDVATKIDSIDNSNLFDYLMITKYKPKNYQELVKQEPTNMKEILFSKEG